MTNQVIRQLDENTINQIAAGEVIENPSSVVKELVENSIDAESTQIIIKIKNGGKSYIEVFDNGIGMSREDMSVCYHKHATSKIKNVHDLISIHTLGFRGEALASIASVAKVTIQSKRETDDYGYEINLENSEIVKETVCAFPNSGTKIIVEDLFYNIPARKVFLENEKTTKETKYIVDLVHRLSMANPHIRFLLYIDDTLLFQTNGNGNLQQIIASVYNMETAKNLLYVDTEVYGVKVRGYISKPEDCVGNRTKQSFFINNRYVKMDILSQALRTAYNEFAVTKKYPVCVLFLEMEQDKIDVNVHPRKIEIRFKHNIFPVIMSAVRSCLSKNTSYPNVEVTRLKTPERTNVTQSETREKPTNVIIDIGNTVPRQSFETSQKIIEEDLDSLNDIDNTEVLFEYDFIEVEETDTLEKSNEQLVLQVADDYHNGFKDYENVNVVGQINRSYIIAEHSDGMIMIDQHAAHERILYEKFLKAFDEKSILSIESLIPDTIELDFSDYLVVKKHLDFFEQYGFTLEDFGSKTFVIRKYPSIFKEHQIKQTVITMIDELLNIENKSIVGDFIHKKIIMKSCKSAIKANMTLNKLQMESLLNDLVKCDNPYHCPHGRPVIINFSSYDIEKSFNRIV